LDGLSIKGLINEGRPGSFQHAETAHKIQRYDAYMRERLCS
jgi:hypothetical protein